MRGNGISRGMGMAVAVVLLAVAYLAQSTNVQAQASAAAGDCFMWIDVATGKRLPTTPVGIPSVERGGTGAAHLFGRAHLTNGVDAFRDADGNWINSATGGYLPTTPVGTPSVEQGGTGAAHLFGRAHLTNGVDALRVPCPPTSTASSTIGGGYLGGELVKNSGWVRSTERFATTDVITNQFSDRADPVGGGFLIGYKFAPWANNIIVSPFASFDFLNAPVNHTFPGGSYLGTTANFMGTGGVKIGPQFGAGVWLYGIGGVSVMNETLNINFIPVASSQSAWVAGGTVGVGGAFQPSFLQGFGRPVSVFAEYQHTWWQSANFNTPAASPLFNYNFARQDDVVKFGFTVDLSAPPQAPVRSYPVKALPSK